MARLWRVLPSADPDGRRVDRAPASAHEAHHVCRVLRLQPGRARSPSSTAAAGSGRRRSSRRVRRRGACGSRGARAPVEAPLERRAVPGPAVGRAHGVGRPEGHRDRRAAVIGWLSRARGAPRATRTARLARWRRIAVEACKQCGRRTVPEHRPLAGELPRPRGGRARRSCSTRGAGVPPLGASGGPPRRGAGWRSVPRAASPTRRSTGRIARGLARASLGPRTLRAETAGLVAAAIVLHRWGDLGGAG